MSYKMLYIDISDGEYSAHIEYTESLFTNLDSVTAPLAITDMYRALERNRIYKGTYPKNADEAAQRVEEAFADGLISEDRYKVLTHEGTSN